MEVAHSLRLIVIVSVQELVQSPHDDPRARLHLLSFLLHNPGKYPCLKLVRMPPLYMIFDPILGAFRAIRRVLRQHVCAYRRGCHLLRLGWTPKHWPREAVPSKVVAVPELFPLGLVGLKQPDKLFSRKHPRAFRLAVALDLFLLPLELLLLLPRTLFRAPRPLGFLGLGCVRRRPRSTRFGSRWR